MEQFGSLELYINNGVANMFVTSGCKTQAEFEQFDATNYFIQEVISDTEKFSYAADIVRRNQHLMSDYNLERASYPKVPSDLCVTVGWTCNAGGMLVRSKEFGMKELDAALAAAEAIKSGRSLESMTA